MGFETLDSIDNDLKLKSKLSSEGQSSSLKSLRCMKKKYPEKIQMTTKRCNNLDLVLKP